MRIQCSRLQNDPFHNSQYENCKKIFTNRIRSISVYKCTHFYNRLCFYYSEKMFILSQFTDIQITDNFEHWLFIAIL